MATPPLPAAYVERMTALLGDEAAEFFASYDRPARPGLRVNTHKITPEEFQQRSPWPLEPVPWCPTGFYLPEDAPAGKHPWHAAGVYYLQEPSAMSAVEAMEIGAGMWVADVCAAPGGKSTQILDHLDEQSLLVANEVIGSRVKSLGENLERWGAELAVITNQDVGRLGVLETGQVRASIGRCAMFRRKSLPPEPRGADRMVASAYQRLGTAPTGPPRCRGAVDGARWRADLQHVHLRTGGKRAGDCRVSRYASDVVARSDRSGPL